MPGNSDRLKAPPRTARHVAASAAVALVVFAAVVVAVPLPSFPRDYSVVVEDREGQVLRVFLNGDEQWLLPPEATPVPAALREAVTTFEDERFFFHGGVDPVAVVRAVYQNISEGRRVSGASTISMQVARLAGNRPRTLGAKILEMLQALKLEAVYSKDEILSLYLDHAPYGGNVRGYRTAAYRYFGKAPDRLTWAEAATLAVLPNAPATISPTASPEVLVARRNALLRRLHASDHFDEVVLQAALAEPAPRGLVAFPVHAPHLADRLRVERREADPFRLRSTLDLDIQLLIERQVDYHARYLESQGIKNVSVVVADTARGEVVSYVGSQAYFDDRVNGSVDGVAARRSTGSIFKPFLYALAMDEGMLIPETLVEDVPVQYGAYSPSNIDGDFNGLVEAREALARSLNVPAVNILHDYGLPRFYRFLRSAGLEGLFRSADDYGLPLVLGGAEASPLEMAGLYRGLAVGGSFSPLRYRADERPSPPRRLISPGASELTLDILTEVARPGVEQFWNVYEGGLPVSWKTGTSFGRRDAWAIGTTDAWTVVVWTGNFTGEENANLTSTVSAGTLLFDIFNALPEAVPADRAARGGSGGAAAGGEDGMTSGGGDLADPTFDPPAGALFEEVEICLETGYRATAQCEDTVTSRAPAGAKPLAACPYHRTIYVTADGAYQVNSSCWEPGNYRPESRLFYSAAVSQYLRSRGVVLEAIPPFAPGCLAQVSDDALELVYPLPDARIFVPRDLDGDLERVAFRAAHRDPGTRLFWYLNGEYLGTTEDPHVVAHGVEAGSHQVEVVDQAGNRVGARFFVATTR